MTTPIKFLIVDDMPQMCKILFSILSDLGWKDVSVAKSGKQALALIQDNNYTIMLLDNNMPEMEGLEVLSILKSLQLEHSPKVIMVTADNKRSTVETAINAGAADFIVKPFQPQLLDDKINRILKTL
jgi:two-component system chemotaxis response regulator CheY